MKASKLIATSLRAVLISVAKVDHLVLCLEGLESSGFVHEDGSSDGHGVGVGLLRPDPDQRFYPSRY